MFAGGLVTNTNQSAMFTRFQCRDASLDIDAAYYNPAGLVHMNDGFYLSLNNQTMGQLNMISTDYSNITEDSKEYRGKVGILIFPAGYGVFKTGRFAFSVGVMPIAGDGKSTWSDGLPSYEMEVADYGKVMVSEISTVEELLTNIDGQARSYSNIGNYKADISHVSSSLSMGYQGNIAYQINDYISIAAGARIVHARSWIKGSVSNMTITYTDTNGESSVVTPGDHYRTIADDVTAVNDTSSLAIAIADNLRNEADYIDQWSELEADVLLTGVGITPVISINYSPSLYTNWSFKYEFRTNLDVETRIIDGKDGDGNFVDGKKYISDIPAMLSLGLTRNPSPRFMFYAGLHYYFDKPIDFDGDEEISIEMIEKNTYELAYGAEYQMNSKYRLSAGILLSRPGVNANYQNERRFALASNTLGAGLGIRISPLIDLNIGGSYTLYKKDEKIYSHDPDDGINEIATVSEYYDSRKWVLSIGVDFLFGEL
jgi:long-chain fatty acid transport protein